MHLMARVPGESRDAEGHMVHFKIVIFFSRSPLHFAAENNLLDMVNLLLENSAHVNSLNFAANTPLMAASGRGHTEVLV